MRVLRAIPAMLILVLVACGINNVNISISPEKATVVTGSQIQFSSSVGNSGNKAVSWAATGGTVDSTGLYTAPALPGICYVAVTSQADSSKTATAVITVVTPVMITPPSITLAPGGTQTFTAIMPATGDTNVTWSITENTGGTVVGGTINSAGLYTAPINAADTAVFHIVATSKVDSTKSATALVTIQTPVVVLPSTASIKVSTQQQFTATVRATGSTIVTWTVQVGDLGAIDATTGLYTAPTTAGTYHVVATAADSSTGRATVTVTP